MPIWRSNSKEENKRPSQNNGSSRSEHLLPENIKVLYFCRKHLYFFYKSFRLYKKLMIFILYRKIDHFLSRKLEGERRDRREETKMRGQSRFHAYCVVWFGCSLWSQPFNIQTSKFINTAIKAWRIFKYCLSSIIQNLI